MMYRIEYNNLTIYDASNPALQILSGNADFELNKAGSLTITLPASHKYIDRIERLKHIIKLYDNNDTLILNYPNIYVNTFNKEFLGETTDILFKYFYFYKEI